MLPCDFNLSIGETKGYNSKILVSKRSMKIDLNRDISKDKLPEHGKVEGVTHDAPMKRTDQPVKVDHLVIHYDNLKMIAEKHNNEEIAITFSIVGAGLIAYHF